MRKEISPHCLCVYYQASIDKKRAWFIVGAFRNEDNIAFVRAIDGCNDQLEFFVPSGLVDEFLVLMGYFVKHGYVQTFQQLPNRFA